MKLPDMKIAVSKETVIKYAATAVFVALMAAAAVTCAHFAADGEAYMETDAAADIGYVDIVENDDAVPPHGVGNDGGRETNDTVSAGAHDDEVGTVVGETGAENDGDADVDVVGGGADSADGVDEADEGTETHVQALPPMEIVTAETKKETEPVETEPPIETEPPVVTEPPVETEPPVVTETTAAETTAAVETTAAETTAAVETTAVETTADSDPASTEGTEG